MLLTKNLESTLAGKKAKPRMYLVAMNTSYELTNQTERQMERGGVVQGKWEKRVKLFKVKWGSLVRFLSFCGLNSDRVAVTGPHTTSSDEFA